MKDLKIFLLLGIVLIFCSAVWADIPKQINFQGILKDSLGNPYPDGNYSITFRIYDASSGGNILWQEGQLIAISGGLFNHLLGSASPIPESVFNDSLRWLGIQVAGNPEITPRRQLVSVPYCYVADFAQNAARLGGVDESNLVRRTGPDSVVSTSGTAFLGNVSGSGGIPLSGVRGLAENTSTGPAYGGYFTTSSSGTGGHYGVYGFALGSSSSDAVGAFGTAQNSSTGDAYGGYFTTPASGTGIHYAVFGEAHSSSVNSVYGSFGAAENTSSGDAYGGYFGTFSGGTGSHYGVYGDAFGSAAFPTYGSSGRANNTSTGVAYGGFFTTTTNGTGSHYGVRGEGFGSASASTIGSYGRAENTSTGSAYGGFFKSDSLGTGTHYGIKAESYGSTNAVPQYVNGVDGYAQHTGNGFPTGGLFLANSESGTCQGVSASAVANSSINDAFGVKASASNLSSRRAYGGYFEASSAGTGTHYGVYGSGFGSSSLSTYGSYGSADNTSTGTAYGGFFTTTYAGTGSHYAVYGNGQGASSSPTHGIFGYADNTSTGLAFGGRFFTTSSGTGNHYGVDGVGYSSSSSAAVGCSGYADNTSTGFAYGGLFTATSSGTGPHYGVYGVETAGGSGAAVYAAGDFAGSGAKYAVAKTSQGNRLLSVIEAPEVWFEDFGEGQLSNGKAHIELDPLFLETVTINGLNPMKVFVQLEGDCNGVYVVKGTTGFDVTELKNGASHAQFSYRIIAKRKGYENQRLLQTTLGMDDPNLHPELWQEMEKRNKEAKASPQIEK